MLRRVWLLMVVVGVVKGQNSPTHVVSYPTMNPCKQGGCPSAQFDKGYFVQTNGGLGSVPANGYDLWGPDGMPLYHLDVVAPDGTAAHLRDIAIDTDATAIVAISYGGYGGRGHVKGSGIVIVDSTGKQSQFIDADRWLPAHARFGPDHSIWVSGTQYEPLRDGDDKDHVSRGEYNVVRKYSRNGQLIGEFLPRSSFPPGLPPADYGKILTANDRIGVLTHPGNVGKYPEWVELDLDGNVIGRWKLGPDTTSDPDTHRMTYQLGELAFTADARLLAQPQGYLTHKRQIMIFDRQTSSWQPTTAVGSPPAEAYLVGADGNTLAFERRNDSVSVIRISLPQSQ